MKRRLIAALTAGVMAMALTACSSDSSAGGSGSGTNSTQQSGQSPDTPSAGDTGSADVSSPTDTGSADASSTSTDTGTDTGSDEPSTGDQGSAPGTVTLQGDLDSDGQAWFGAMCGGMTPVIIALTTAMASASADESADVSEVQQDLAGKFDAAATALDKTAGSLGSMPAPSIDNGSEFAQTVVAGFKTMSGALSDMAEQVGTADVSSVSELSDVMSDASQTMASDMSMFDNFEPGADLQQQLQQIPECEKLAQMGAFGGN